MWILCCLTSGLQLCLDFAKWVKHSVKYKFKCLLIFIHVKGTFFSENVYPCKSCRPQRWSILDFWKCLKVTLLLVQSGFFRRWWRALGIFVNTTQRSNAFCSPSVIRAVVAFWTGAEKSWRSFHQLSCLRRCCATCRHELKHFPSSGFNAWKRIDLLQLGLVCQGHLYLFLDRVIL